MNEEFHLKPIINEIEDRITSLTRVTLTQVTGFGITKTELLTIQILAKITLAFAIIITITETISKRLMHNRLSITKDPKPMMIGIPEKTNSEKMNKLLNSSTTKKIGNSIVTLEVDHITLEAIIAITVETQRDLNHQILDRIKYSLKLPTGLRKKSITVMLSLISFL